MVMQGFNFLTSASVYYFMQYKTGVFEFVELGSGLILIWLSAFGQI